MSQTVQSCNSQQGRGRCLRISRLGDVGKPLTTVLVVPFILDSAVLITRKTTLPVMTIMRSFQCPTLSTKKAEIALPIIATPEFQLVNAGIQLVALTQPTIPAAERFSTLDAMMKDL